MVKINKEGYRIIAVTAIVTAAIVVLASIFLGAWAIWLAGLIFVSSLGFELFFFRDPVREVCRDKNIVFSPADGKVVALEVVEESEFLGCKCIQLSVFMSLTSVHANWFPVGGKVVYFRHHHGKYMVAYHPKSSELNERTTTVVDTGAHKVMFRQIAGMIARRIVSYAEPGRDVEQNSRAGFIKFGSRVDLFLPVDSEILVLIGDKVTGSQTPLARLK